MKGLSLFNHLEDLDAESKYLVHKAKEATQLSYAPYSKFKVVGPVYLLKEKCIVIAVEVSSSLPSSFSESLPRAISVLPRSTARWFSSPGSLSAFVPGARRGHGAALGLAAMR